MRQSTPVISAMAAILTAVLLHAAPAQAQATRTWVSGVGDDVNPCSRTAPCKTFAGAISKTAVNGEINCLDPAGYGTVTITKSITIDCRNTHASLLNSGVNAVLIPFDNFTAGGEIRKTVRLRGVTLNGGDTGTAGVRITGTSSAGSEVFIEDVVIDGNYGGIGRGISDERLGGGELTVRNTTVRNVANTAIVINPGAGTGSTRIDAVLDTINVHNANYGISVGSGARVMINRALLTGNTQAGLETEGPFAAPEVNLYNSVSSNNGLGIETTASTVRLSNTEISFNATGISGTTFSHGNNRIIGNTSAGTMPTLLNPAQQ